MYVLGSREARDCAQALGAGLRCHPHTLPQARSDFEERNERVNFIILRVIHLHGLASHLHRLVQVNKARAMHIRWSKNTASIVHYHMM